MKLRLDGGLPCVNGEVTGADGRRVALRTILVDTGSVSTVFAARRMAEIGIEAALTDLVHTIRGVGGTEPVFTRRVARLAIGSLAVPDFEIEIAGMRYGFELDGILGMDFLMATGAVIDLSRMELRRARGTRKNA